MTNESKPGHVDVVVTVEDAHLARIDAVAHRLRAAGLGGDQTLASAGLITGRIPQGGLAGLRSVEGVKAVEASGPVQIAPPGAGIQ